MPVPLRNEPRFSFGIQIDIISEYNKSDANLAAGPDTPQKRCHKG